ncbi:glycosyltransferase [Niallia circulans]|uniref:Glycosyltransferase n=2 Tax=Niallia circulans TaxID=1397 RepID=A0A553SQ74_NIACI|nr:glycosyltransferase [Niallia circulans]
MIVKNESRIIERCLDSAAPIIDCLSICDTGSTDGTVQIIKNWANVNGKNCTVHHTPFQNFGYNRTLSVKLAQQTYPDSDYILLLDADMILQVEAGFTKKELAADQYLVMQMNNSLKYWNTRLVSARKQWESVGVTHEYWEMKRDVSEIVEIGKLTTLYILDKEDGGSKQDKFERDKRLLEEAINNNENDKHLKQRYLFYLAQTYYDLQEWDNAIEAYQKRIKEGGWEEEIYYSMHKIGLAYEQLSMYFPVGEKADRFLSLALLHLQRAWEFRPSRGEAIYHLARIHRENKHYHICLLYAAEGKAISFPVDDLLFVDFPVHDYLFDYELAIAAYYIEEKREIGLKALNSLLERQDKLPANMQQWLSETNKFYQSH